ncbi:MAG TPA: amino acid adenylation domain-containing protein, partial [Acidimicrobiales bacterium]|nr:amino acid adenylation domain-containing protein [Acidimicrobiales bacterium]
MPPNDIIDIYPLSPMQSGMLFHTLFEPTASIYTAQWTCLLTGPLDERAFVAAWEGVVARHDAFRTSFVWQGLPDPVQVVHARTTIPIEHQDWRHRSPEQQDADLEAFLAADRERPFDLARPPLQRLALLRVGDRAVRFVWTFHHILLDGWCQAVVLAELVTRYEAEVAGLVVDLPPAPQFREYISWLAQRDARADEMYWRQTLAGINGATPLGIDRGEQAGDGRPGDAPAEPGYAFVILDEGETAAIQATAQQLRVTGNRLLEAAFAVVLHRYSGDDDVTYGLTVAGRPPELDGADEIVGMFINTVPVRAHVDGEATVASWLRDLDAQQAARQPYEHAALTDVQSWSDVQHPARLFNVVLIPQYPTDFGSAAVGGVEISDGRLLERTNYPLTVVSFPGRELAIAAAYDTARFDGDLVQQLLDHVAVVLRAMTTDTSRTVGSLPVLSADDERQVIVTWNRTEAPYPDRPLHALFEQQAARAPSAVAVIAGEAEVTYGALNARANQLAHRLRALGVGTDVPVGICTDRSPDMVVAMLGVLKAGGAYVPLDALLYPPDRLAFMVTDSGAPVVVTQGLTGAALPEVRAHVVQLDAHDIDTFPTTNPDAGVGLDDLAYVLYTSGSTGLPKGVLVPHRGLANLAAALDIIKVTERSRVLQFAPYSFDISVGDLILALTSGATLCLATLDSLVSPDALVEQLRTQRVTNIQIVPSIMSTLPVDELPDLETILVGAEICPTELVARWATPGRRFLNVYGPTEGTICASYMECTDPRRTPAIGKPIPNGRIYVLDRHGRPVPVGVPGEITIGGVGVARGYLNRPELTEQCFVPDPFASEAGARMYRSGDLGRWMPDGNLEFLGRMDDQVKVRGHRVELGEVEAILGMHEDVRECAVTAHGEGVNRRLVAYVVPGAR